MKTKLLFILLLLTANACAFLGKGGDLNSYSADYHSKAHPNPLFIIVNTHENENSQFSPSVSRGKTNIETIRTYVHETVEIDWDDLVGKTYFEVLEIVLPGYLDVINIKADQGDYDAAKSILEIAVEAGNIKMAALLVASGAEKQDAYKQALTMIENNKKYILFGYGNIKDKVKLRSKAGKKTFDKLAKVLDCSCKQLLQKFLISQEFSKKMTNWDGQSHHPKVSLYDKINNLLNTKSNHACFMSGTYPPFFNVATRLHWMVLLASIKDVSQFIENYKDLIRINAKDEYGKTALDYAYELQKSKSDIEIQNKILLLQQGGGLSGTEVSE